MWAFFSPVLLTAVILDFPSVSLGQAKGLSWNRHIVRIALGLQILKAPRHRPTSSRRLIKLSCSFLDFGGGFLDEIFAIVQNFKMNFLQFSANVDIF